MGFDFGKQLVSQVKDRVFKKVIGGVGDFIRGIPGIGNSADAFIRNKYTTDHFSFPLDVEQDPGLGNQGHYIHLIIYTNIGVTHITHHHGSHLPQNLRQWGDCIKYEVLVSEQDYLHNDLHWKDHYAFSYSCQHLPSWVQHIPFHSVLL